MAYAVRTFQADDAVRRFLQAGILLRLRVWGVVCGDQVHCSVRDRRDRSAPVGFRTQWRIHFRHDAIREDRFVAQRDIVWRGLAGDGQAFRLGCADRFEGSGGADVLEVDVHAGTARRFNIARDDAQLSVLGDAGHAELMADRSLVDDAAVMMLAMLDEIQPGGFRIGEHLVENRVRHGSAVIADRGDRVRPLVWVFVLIRDTGKMRPPVLRIGRLGSSTIHGGAHAQVVPCGQRTVMGRVVMLEIIDGVARLGGQHVIGARRARTDWFAVHRRQRVRHDQHPRVPTGSRRGAPGTHGFLVGLSWIAEVDVRVGESGSHRKSGRVDVAVAHGSRLVEESPAVRAGDDQIDSLPRIPYADVMQREHTLGSFRRRVCGTWLRAWLPRRNSRNGIPDVPNAPDGTSGRCRVRWWSRTADSCR